MSRKKYIILLVVTITLLAGYLVIRHFLGSPAVERRIGSELKELVRKGSDGLYRLEIGKIKVDPDNINVSLYNLTLTPDTLIYQTQVKEKRAPEHLFAITLDRIVLENITPASFIVDKKVILNSVHIHKGVLTANQKLYDFHKNKVDDTTKVKMDLYALLENDLNEVRIDTIVATGLDLVYQTSGKKARKTELKNLDFLMEDLQISEDSGKDTSLFLYSKSLAVRLKDFNLPVGNNMYDLSIDTMNMMITGSTTFTDIHNLKIASPLGETEFSNRNKSQLERFDIRFPLLVLKNFNYQQLLADGILMADSAGIDGAQVRIFKDRTQPSDGKSKVGQYPHQLLKKAEIMIRIPEMSFVHSLVEYREKSDVTQEIGSVAFTSINAKVTNVFNADEDIRMQPVMVLKASARFMGAAPLSATFRFFNDRKGGAFEVDGDFGAFDATIINKASVPLGLVEIKNGKVPDLHFRLKGDDYSATSSIHLEYNDLQVEVLKQEDGNEDYGKKGLLTFIANTFVLKSSNISGRNRKQDVNIAYTRDVERSMFNLIWKTAFAGIKDMVGAGGLGKDKDRVKVE